MSAENSADEYDRRIVDLCPDGCLADEIPDSVRDLRSRADTRSSIAVGLFAIGGAAAVTGLVLAYLNLERINDGEISVAPFAGRDEVGLSTVIRF